MLCLCGKVREISRRESRKQMNLQFPNARLFIHDLISNEHLSGPDAIVQASYEFGLIPVNSSGNLNCEHRGDGHCACFIAAKDILSKHLAGKPSSARVTPEIINVIWSSIERQGEQYQKSLDNKEASTTERCNRIAPMLFDLILQEVRRYS